MDPEDIGLSDRPLGGIAVSLARFERSLWRDVEDAPRHIKDVAIALSAQGRKLVTGDAGAPDKKREMWSEDRWAAIMGEKKNSNKSSTGKNGKTSVRERAALEVLLKDAERAFAPRHVPQRREALRYFESFAASVYRWVANPQSLLEHTSADIRTTSSQLHAAVSDAGGAQSNVSRLLVPIVGNDDPATLLRVLGEDPGALESNTYRERAGASSIAMYEEQDRCCRIILQSVKEKRAALLRYTTPPSGGKTSLATALGGALGALSPPRTAVYTCYNMTVCVGVCKSLFAAQIPFAVWTRGMGVPSHLCTGGDRKARENADLVLADAQVAPTVEQRVKECIVCHRKLPRPPVIHVADLESAALIGQGSDVLLVDEPTAGCEAPNSPVTRAYANIILSPAQATVLISATLPEFDQLSLVTRVFLRTFPDAALMTVGSSRPPPFCEAMVHGMGYVSPHMVVPSASVVEDPCLMRFYGPRALNRVSVTTEDLAETKDTLSTGGILRIAQRWLSRVSSPPAPVPNEDTPCNSASVLEGILTRSPPAVGTLVVCGNVVRALRSAGLEELLQESERSHFAALARYEAAEIAWKTATRRAEDSRDADASVELQEAPAILWPGHLTLGSVEHRRLYGHSVARPSISFRGDDVVEAFRSVPAMTGALLLSGVGILGGGQPPEYQRFVERLVERSSLHVIFADPSVVYGTNLPFARLIVATPRTLHTTAFLRQLCGRVSRSGRRVQGAIVFPTMEDAQIAFSDPTQSSVEAHTLENSLREILRSD